jgi:hypothetical protein
MPLIMQAHRSEDAQQKLVPPYVPYRSFRNFVDSLKQGIPARIDRSVMASMSGALQSQLTTALRYLGLIKATGQPTDMLANIVNSEGPERTKALKTMLFQSYSFLFADFQISTATPRMLEEKFAEAGASGGTLDKCMLFFIAAAKDAELELSPHLKVQRGARTTRPRGRIRPSDSTTNADPLTLNGSDSMEMTWEQMLLSKFPSFDPSWPDEVKSKWFDGFHRLMRVGKPQEEK